MPPATQRPVISESSTAAAGTARQPSKPHAGTARQAAKPPASSRPPAAERTDNTTRSSTGRPKIATNGPGTYHEARSSVKATSKRGRLIRYDLRVEKGLPFDALATARLIQQILNDERSWSGSGTWRFELVSSAKDAELHAYIATPRSTDKLCAPLQTRGDVSCQNGNRVVLNAKRWAFGAKTYGRDLTGYRGYLINHEFGHAIGFGHVRCPGRGKLAPVMMQQTKGLGGCRPHPWPSRKNR
ncbi:MAG: DUF3152 domain-containing protein [Propionibacteriaceae bacterium]|nr:DUF3152 domain-containing protein [Propionibacteriaceae bacterium]